MDKSDKIIEEIFQYKGIIFDFDGTIVDLNTDWQAVKKSLSSLVFLEKGYNDNFTPLAKKVLCYRSGDICFFDKITEIISSFEMKKERYVFNDKLIDYINKNLDKKIAIYSMNTDRTIRNFISKYFINKPDIISINNCQEAKPTEKDLLKIIGGWEFNLKDVAFVGNSSNDLLSGKKAKIKTYII
jgi:phosphoglycolate phosphatase-like HAD superfamily hydrolase